MASMPKSEIVPQEGRLDHKDYALISYDFIPGSYKSVNNIRDNFVDDITKAMKANFPGYDSNIEGYIVMFNPLNIPKWRIDAWIPVKGISMKNSEVEKIVLQYMQSEKKKFDMINDFIYPDVMLELGKWKQV